MRFNLQDIKKTVQYRGGEPSVTLQFLKPGELQAEIEQLVTYHESLLGQPQRRFSRDDARAVVADYRLANCLLATLSSWYVWRQRDWAEVLAGYHQSPDEAELASPGALRLALYAFVNEKYHGFLDRQTREKALRAFGKQYRLDVPALEYLLALDSEEEALLVRSTEQAPMAQDVATRYNQWVFEAALFNASEVRFEIDIASFLQQQEGLFAQSEISTGIGVAIKRLCFLARKLGVYYELSYDAALPDQQTSGVLHLLLYGPQDVTGVPQQYGIRLARLCRLLLGYSATGSAAPVARRKKASTLSSAIVRAEAKVHFLQRAYRYTLDASLLRLLPAVEEQEAVEAPAVKPAAATIFDSSIEQSFSEAFFALARGQGVDGWHLEREPEPLLLANSLFIPDFAFTRGRHRIYLEVLGFWTPSYQERKIQKLHQLKDRRDLILAIPTQNRQVYASITSLFPVVYYDDQISVSEVLQVLRTHYEDFKERLALIDALLVRKQVRDQGILLEQRCYELLHCYRRAELQKAVELIVNTDIHWQPGVGLYEPQWMEQLRDTCYQWLQTQQQSIPLSVLLQYMRENMVVLQHCEDGILESLVGQWSQIRIERDSIFDITVYYNEGQAQDTTAPDIQSMDSELEAVEHNEPEKKRTRERRPGSRKRVVEAVPALTQGDLWT